MTPEARDLPLRPNNPQGEVSCVGSRVWFELWHPQWGGYCAPCVVEFHKPSVHDDRGLPCFDVYEWHDGEFPTEALHNRRHYCSPEQVIRWGLEIAAAMKQNGHQLDPETRDSLRALADEVLR